MLYVLKIMFYVAAIASSSLLFMDCAAGEPTSWTAGMWPLIAMLHAFVADMYHDLVRQYKDLIKRL